MESLEQEQREILGSGSYRRIERLFCKWAGEVVGLKYTRGEFAVYGGERSVLRVMYRLSVFGKCEVEDRGKTQYLLKVFCDVESAIDVILRLDGMILNVEGECEGE